MNAQTHLKALGVNASTTRRLFVGDGSLEKAREVRRKFYAGKDANARRRDVALCVIRVLRIFRVTAARVEGLGPGHAVVGRRFKYTTLAHHDLYGCLP